MNAKFHAPAPGLTQPDVRQGAGLWRTAWVTSPLPIILLLALTAAMEAQDSTCPTNRGTLATTPLIGSDCSDSGTFPSTFNGQFVTSFVSGVIVLTDECGVQ